MTNPKSILAIPPRIANVRLESARDEIAIREGGSRVCGQHRLLVRDEHGRVLRRVSFDNLVTTAGKNYLLQAGLTNGVAAITSWYLGMIAENRHVSDGAITSGAATLTSATAAFTAGDVGRQVTIYGAGASGAALVTTISAYTNGTTVTVAMNAGMTTSGAIISIGPLLTAADTMAGHAGWTEVPAASVTAANRLAWTPGAVSGGAIAAGSATTYTMAAGLPGVVYIHGFFVASNNTIGGTTGTLYSEAEFSQGALAVQANYTISDTYTTSLT
jgi:hypothetical protein